MRLQVATILSLSLQSQSAPQPTLSRMTKPPLQLPGLQPIFAQHWEEQLEYKTASQETALVSAKILRQDV